MTNISLAMNSAFANGIHARRRRLHDPYLAHWLIKGWLLSRANGSFLERCEMCADSIEHFANRETHKEDDPHIRDMVGLTYKTIFYVDLRACPSIDRHLEGDSNGGLGHM